MTDGANSGMTGGLHGAANSCTMARSSLRTAIRRAQWPRRPSISMPTATRWWCWPLPASSCRWCALRRVSPVLGYLAAGAILGPLGLGSLIKQFPVPLLGHRHRCQERRRHRRTRRRLPAVPHRPGAVLRAPDDHAPPGVRAGQPAGRPLRGRHRRHRRAVRQRRRRPR